MVGPAMPMRNLHMPSGTKPVHLGGWKKQTVDPRDHAYAIALHGKFTARPSSVDNRPICSAVEDQGNIGSCTAQMFAALVEANQNRSLLSAARVGVAAPPSVTVGEVSVASDGSVSYLTRIAPPAATPTSKITQASRLFHYYATRKLEGTVAQDSGATIRNTIKAGVLYGVADEAIYPYNVAKFAANPPPLVWSSALKHKVTSYHAIADGDAETMKSVLSAPVPFLIGFGFLVYSKCLSVEMATTGLLCRPGARETLQGAHAVVLVGYDDEKVMPDGSTGAFLVRNSWGTKWGQGGYFWMAQNYVADRALCSDFWVVKSAPI